MDGTNRARILGVDPGLNVTGYGVIETQGTRPEVIEAGVIRSRASSSLSDKLKSIYEGLQEVIAGLEPNSLAIEQLYSHYQRPRTAILMGHARGVICLAASQAGLSPHHYASTQVKKILTGSGRAPKAQIQLAIQHELRMAKLPDPSDVADALAVALCHHYLRKKAA